MRTDLLLCIALMFAFGALPQAMAAKSRKPSSDEKPNCKLAVRTTFKNGKKKVEILEVHAFDRADCREQAKRREISSDPQEIEVVKVTFGFRDPG